MHIEDDPRSVPRGVCWGLAIAVPIWLLLAFACWLAVWS